MVELDEVCDRIKELLEERGGGFGKSWDMIGQSRESWKSIVYDKKIPRVKTLLEICDQLKITMYDFFKVSPPEVNIPITYDTIEALQIFRLLRPEDQEFMITMCKKLTR